MYVYIHIHIEFHYIYIYVYIYTERERDRERERAPIDVIGFVLFLWGTLSDTAPVISSSQQSGILSLLDNK